MGIFDGVLLVSDFDNTLVYTEEAFAAGAPLPTLSAGNRAALAEFIRQGGRFAIATGRALPSFLSVADGLPFNTPCILANGAGIYDMNQQTYLYSAFLPGDIVVRVGELLAAFPTLGMEVYHPDSVVHCMNPNRYVESHQHLTNAPGVVARRVEEIPQPWVKVIFEDEAELLERVCRFLEDCPWMADYELIHSGQHFLELTAKGAHKGGSVQRLAALLGIDMAHVYCIGDHNNDASMLAVSALPLAPENCVARLRQIPGIRILPDCRADAVAAAVALLAERYAK